MYLDLFESNFDAFWHTLIIKYLINTRQNSFLNFSIICYKLLNFHWGFVIKKSRMKFHSFIRNMYYWQIALFLGGKKINILICVNNNKKLISDNNFNIFTRFNKLDFRYLGTLIRSDAIISMETNVRTVAAGKLFRALNR